MKKHITRIFALILSVICVISFSTVSFASDDSSVNERTTSANTKAIVIIPGILGSTLETTSGSEVWLHLINYGKMALNENGGSVYSIRSANYDNYGANNTYKTLYNSL